MSIKFSPPDITDAEITEVIDTLKSGWITTGPKTAKLEKEIASYTNAAGAVCLNSAPAGMEMVLRLFEIGPGDEVITTPYTYTATAAVILHVGATPVFADVKQDSFLIDPKEIEKKITAKTKAIIPVDVAGFPCNYDEILQITQNNKLFSPKNGSLQEQLGRILILADAAHSIGAKYKGREIGSVADFSSFSFHAVKNITTCEGGAVTFNNAIQNPDKIYKKLRTLSLHGQSKDALEKTKVGSWEYDILFPGFKCNMTDLAASIGLIQLQRYKNELVNRREEIFLKFQNGLKSDPRFIIPEYKDGDTISSCHLFLLRIKNINQEERNRIITKMGEMGIPLNVHYKPLPILTCYSDLGYKIENYPNAYKQFENQVTIPLHTLLTDDDIEYIITNLKKI